MLKKFLIGTFVAAAFMVVASTASADCSITTTLRVGSKGAEVSCLQTKVGATADGSFGPMTKASVMAYQASHGLSSDGVVGPMSRAVLNAGGAVVTTAGCPAGALFNSVTGASCTVVTSSVAGCAAGALFSATTGASCVGGTVIVTAGGAGSISDFKKDSSYSAVQVTQGATDKKVVAFTVKADTGSDLAVQLLALDLQRTGGTATVGSSTMSRYMNSVSVWHGSTKVATVNAADFTKSGTTYSKNIQLSGVSVKAGATDTFYITVNAPASMDSADLGHNVWTATVQSLRFVDGTGAIMTDSTTGDLPYAQTFSFETLTSAGTKELKTSLTTGQDAINKAHVVVASTTGTTNDISLLAFSVKATGEIKNITDIPVTVSGGTAKGVAKIADSFSLWKDGVKIDTIDVSEGTADQYGVELTEVLAGGTGDSTAIHFNNVDFDLADGSTTQFVVKVNIKKILGTATNFTEGDTLMAQLSADAADAIVAEDVNGDSFAAAALTGSATAEAIVFRSMGLNATLVSTTATVATGASGAKDIGTYTITFDVTAFGSDVYVDGTKPSVDGTGATASWVIINGANTPTEDVIIRAPGVTALGSLDADARYLVADGTTQRFVITSVVTPGASAAGLTSVQLTKLDYALTNVDGTIQHTTGLGSFVTPSVNLKLTN